MQRCRALLVAAAIVAGQFPSAPLSAAAMPLAAVEIRTEPAPYQISFEGQTISEQPVAATSDNPPINFSASGLPPGISISSSSGALSGTLPYTAAGSYFVTITINDSDGGPVQRSFTWDIQNINQAPLITPVDTQMDTIGTSVSVQPAISDPDGDPINVTASGLPPGVSINYSTGQMTGTPSSVGNYTVTITATDGERGAQSAFSWQISGGTSTTTTTTTAPTTTTTTTTAAPGASTTTTTTTTSTTTTVPEDADTSTTTTSVPGDSPTTTTTPTPEPQEGLAANDDAFTLSSVSGPVNVLGNDRGTDLRLVAVSSPSVGSAEVLPSGAVLVTLPESFAGSVSFSYTVTDASGETATANVVVESGNVLASVAGLVEVNNEPLDSVGAVVNEIEALYRELIEIRLSALQTTFLVFSPILLGLLYLLLRRKESLVAVTGIAYGDVLRGERHGHQSPIGLRHDQTVWFAGRTRRRKGAREYLVEVAAGIRAWVPAENLTDTGR